MGIVNVVNYVTHWRLGCLMSGSLNSICSYELGKSLASFAGMKIVFFIETCLTRSTITKRVSDTQIFDTTWVKQERNDKALRIRTRRFSESRKLVNTGHGHPISSPRVQSEKGPGPTRQQKSWESTRRHSNRDVITFSWLRYNQGETDAGTQSHSLRKI